MKWRMRRCQSCTKRPMKHLGSWFHTALVGALNGVQLKMIQNFQHWLVSEVETISSANSDEIKVRCSIDITITASMYSEIDNRIYARAPLPCLICDCGWASSCLLLYSLNAVYFFPIPDRPKLQ